MKTNFKYKIVQIALGIAMLFTISSCEKDETKAILDSSFSRVKPNLISPTNGFNKEISAADSIENIKFEWNKADYGVKTQINYYLQIDSASRNFAKAINLAIVQTDSFSINVLALNDSLLKKLKLPANILSTIEIRVYATLSTGSDTIMSDVITVQVKPYKYVAPPPVFVESALLYIPGTYQAAGSDPSKSDVKTITTLGGVDSTKKYEAYVYFPAACKIKFTNAPDLAHSVYGKSTNGKLTDATTATEIDIAAEGNYKIVVDIAAKTYIIEKAEWGTIGDATAGLWDNSTPMTYDKGKNVWSVTQDLEAKALKFRANNAWALNYGPANSTELSGFLISTDGAISIPEAGNYTITIDLSRSKVPYKYSYKVVKN